MPRVLFTGGGTAGHVTPNIALMERAGDHNWDIAYVGSASGIEREMVRGLGIPYFIVASGKLRRYFSWRNFVDPLLLFWGVAQSAILCRRWKPDAVFSKGGFVSVPLVVAAWLLRIPVISHESDITPGLANRIIYPLCRKICVTFEATLRYLPAGKLALTGTPVRKSILSGDPAAGLAYLGFSGEKPVLLIFGGSIGSAAINGLVLRFIRELVEIFDVIHVVGKGNLNESIVKLSRSENYLQKEFIGDQFGAILAASTVVVSRAGANSIYELLITRKPHLLIPLGKSASRGDQLENARIFKEYGFSKVLDEDSFVSPMASESIFVETIKDILEHGDEIEEKLKSFEIKDSVSLIFDLIKDSIRKC